MVVVPEILDDQVRSGLGHYPGAAPRRVQLAAVLLEPLFGPSSSRRHACPDPSDRTQPDAFMKYMWVAARIYRDERNNTQHTEDPQSHVPLVTIGARCDLN